MQCFIAIPGLLKLRYFFMTNSLLRRLDKPEILIDSYIIF